jgi:hypothetical protein
MLPVCVLVVLAALPRLSVMSTAPGTTAVCSMAQLRFVRITAPAPMAADVALRMHAYFGLSADLWVQQLCLNVFQQISSTSSTCTVQSVLAL